MLNSRDYSLKIKIDGTWYRKNPDTNAVIKYNGSEWIECTESDIPAELRVNSKNKQEIIVNTEASIALSDIKTLSIDILRKTVCKEASEEELIMFLRLCQTYNLDPFLKEIFFVSGIGILVARDGYLRYANNQSDFEGINSMAVRKNDLFDISAEQKIIHEFAKNNERGEVVGAWAKAKRKGRGYCVVYADFAEYKKTAQAWQKYPSAMICKVAEVQCIKKLYALSGTVSDVEME